MKKQNRGITLIALIITIVVMLILVAVVVSTTINSNLINKVKRAKGEWEEAEREDSNIAGMEVNGVKYDSLQDYVDGLGGSDTGNGAGECTHTYGEWIIDTEATCVAKGSKHQTCTKCGKTVTEEIDKINHILDEDRKCTREGCDYVATPISKESPFIGYYADLDDDGTVDGIIYADLAFDGNGQWTNGQWTNSDGAYSYSAKDKTTLNDYYISQEEEYQYKSFKSKPVIAPINKDNNEANDRFYVIALKDFTTPEYTWFYFYKNAVDENYNGLMDPSDTELEFRSDYCVGRKNTNTMISIWDKNGGEGGYARATQDNQDIWKHIKGYIETEAEEYRNWFIPSRAEWGAFGKFATDQGLTSNTWDDAGNMTEGNYNTNYGLSCEYWSSSQNDAGSAWSAGFSQRLYVRLRRPRQHLCASERDFLIV